MDPSDELEPQLPDYLQVPAHCAPIGSNEEEKASNNVCKRMAHIVEVLIDPNECEANEFRQAVEEVGQALLPLLQLEPSLVNTFEAICESERIIIFRVIWEDDEGRMRVNTGYRVQHNSALGPFKGGLRFHPSVNLSICRFLAFEQTFKNSLTGLPMGGAKGGANVDPKTMSPAEMRRFCQAFMQELYRYIGPELDIPAGDVGVSSREIGFMTGTYTHLTQQMATGALSSKPLGIGGSCLRTESTGFGIAVMAEMAIKELMDKSLEGMTASVSGAGNVALHCALKLTQMKAKVITLSDSSGTLFCKEGFTEDEVRKIMKIKLGSHGKARMGEVAEKLETDGCMEYNEGQNAWQYPCDMAIPCATQGEFSAADLQRLTEDRNGFRLKALLVGSNMGLTQDALESIRGLVEEKKLVFVPDKLANLAGVSVSYLEMTQNAQRGVPWKAQKVAAVMKEVLAATFESVMKVARKQSNRWDLWSACHIHSFIRLHEAMTEQGHVWNFKEPSMSPPTSTHSRVSAKGRTKATTAAASSKISPKSGSKGESEASQKARVKASPA